jgi:hypothetical protein
MKNLKIVARKDALQCVSTFLYSFDFWEFLNFCEEFIQSFDGQNFTFLVNRFVFAEISDFFNIFVLWWPLRGGGRRGSVPRVGGGLGWR